MVVFLEWDYGPANCFLHVHQTLGCQRRVMHVEQLGVECAHRAFFLELIHSSVDLDSGYVQTFSKIDVAILHLLFNLPPP